MNFNESWNNIDKTTPAAEQLKQDPAMLGAVLINKVTNVSMLQYRQPRNFVDGVLSFKTKEQRKYELSEKVNEVEGFREQIIESLLNEQYSDGIINFLKYALFKEDTRDDMKWEAGTSPSERIRQFAENIVFENLPVFEKYIENTTPGNTKQTFRILEKIIQLNQGKIFEYILDGDLENPEEIFIKFDQIRNTGNVPDDFKDDFSKLPGSNNYLTILEFLKKQAPVINKKIGEGLNQTPKMNDIIHEYVAGFELALKHLPIDQAKELSLNIGELFKIQDDQHRGVLDIFIADYAVEVNGVGSEAASEFSHARARELKIGEKIFATAGYEYKEIGAVWFKSAPQEKYRDMMISNFACLHALEGQRPGSAKYLTDNFGIVCFSRYPIEVLLKQYDERDKSDVPFGIYATGRTDHNGSMYAFNKKGKIEELSSKTELNGYTLKIIEVNNTVDAARKIINLTKKLNKKASFMFVNAHGNSEEIALGQFNNFRPDLNIKDISKPGTKKFFDYFEEGATLVLSSCLTGSEKGIAEEIANTSGMTVIASDRLTQGMSKLEVEQYRNNSLKFDVAFYTDKKKGSNIIFNDKQ
jgi:hypothetical protein